MCVCVLLDAVDEDSLLLDVTTSSSSSSKNSAVGKTTGGGAPAAVSAGGGAPAAVVDCWWSLMLQQLCAVVVKRGYYVRRNWRALFSQILLPALFVCVAMTVALTAPQVSGAEYAFFVFFRNSKNMTFLRFFLKMMYRKVVKSVGSGAV